MTILRIVLLSLLSTGLAWSQESRLHAEFRQEMDQLRSCTMFTFKSVPGCAEALFTGHPLHVAIGSIAPQNGFAAGPAFVYHWTPNERWRLNFNADAVISANASWRAGVYVKAIYVPKEEIGVSSAPPSTSLVREYPILSAYTQTISLNKLSFFGLGPNTSSAQRSFFGMTETITGTSAVLPVFNPLKISLFGELNGRFVSVRGNHNESSPSIEQLYTSVTAPGLSGQPSFFQAGEGIRLKPQFLDDHIQLNYFALFQQFVSPSNSVNSFRRFSVDLAHTFPLYRSVQSARPKDTNGPDDCARGLSDQTCPPISRNRQGSIGLRLFITESIAPAGHDVPFYFQPTLGGSDINANPSLPSFQDYRFRAPNALLLRESFEHSIWGPLGFTFMADQGKVALTRGEIGFSHLTHSFATGLTLRAGGFPQVSLTYAWGGGEGDHTIFSVNTSLLGGSLRPSLY